MANYDQPSDLESSVALLDASMESRLFTTVRFMQQGNEKRRHVMLDGE